ncbi:DUF2933 domain-containing protein [Porticoccus sp.]
MSGERNSFWLSGKGLAALLLIAGASYFLLMEHRQHLFAALPYLILLLCPLMHLFMHRGHGGHSHHSTSRDESQGEQSQSHVHHGGGRPDE